MATLDMDTDIFVPLISGNAAAIVYHLRIGKNNGDLSKEALASWIEHVVASLVLMERQREGAMEELKKERIALAEKNETANVFMNQVKKLQAKLHEAGLLDHA